MMNILICEWCGFVCEKEIEDDGLMSLCPCCGVVDEGIDGNE
jgi:rubrerythrin